MRASRVTAMVMTAGCFVGAACGLSPDREPVPITAPTVLAPSSTAGPTPATSVRVFFVQPGADAEQPLQGSARLASSPREVFEALFDGLDRDDRAQGLLTAIPPGTTVRSANIGPDATLTLDIDRTFFAVRGLEQQQALAQIVFTAAEIPGVSRVVLLVDGQRTSWPRGDGSVSASALTPVDFVAFDPTTQPTSLPDPPDSAASRVTDPGS